MTVNMGGLAIDRAKVAVLRRSLGAHLAMYRRAAGFAQPELARALGRTRSMISRIEHGARTMPEALWKIADELCHAQGALVAEYQTLAEVEQDYRAQCRAQRAQARQSQAQAELDALRASPVPWLLQSDSRDDGWPGMTGVDGELAEELLRVVIKLIRSVGRRKAVGLVGYVLAVVGLSSLDAEESTRIVQAVQVPRRMDDKVVTNLAVSLAQCKRLEDTLGPCEVLDSVVAQHGIVRRLLQGCPDRLRKPLSFVDSEMASAIGSYLTDMGHPQQAMRYFAHARKAGHDAGNPACAAYAAARASFTAFLRGDTPTALDTAAAARSLAARTHDVKLKALAEQMAAAAYALDGQYQPCMAACGRAHEFLASTDECGRDSLAYWVHEGTLGSQRSLFLCLLGKPKHAVEAASTACAQYDRTFARNYASCQVRLGRALVLSRDITEASRILGQAASQAHLSPRLTRELHTARALLQPWDNTHAVTTLDAQLDHLGLRSFGV